MPLAGTEGPGANSGAKLNWASTAPVGAAHSSHIRRFRQRQPNDGQVTLSQLKGRIRNAMTYHDQWRSLSARIHGLAAASELHTRFLGVQGDDPLGTNRFLYDQAVNVLASLETFHGQFHRHVPAEALSTIQQFLDNSRPLIADQRGSPQMRHHRCWSLMVRLRAFETEVSFILSDAQEAIRVRSERAFAHLQRLIVADPDVARKWRDAFDEHETACEKLGGAHLLLHGVWAFKAHAPGGRTDLVFQDQITDLTGVERFADGIVLTEWKRALDLGDAPTKFAEALRQARDYAGGVLAGFELTGYRYVVVITEEQVEPLDDQVVDGVVYRHLNIAVKPLVPSRAARN